MGMTDKQFNAFLRLILEQLDESIENNDIKKIKKLKKMLEEMMKD